MFIYTSVLKRAVDSFNSCNLQHSLFHIIQFYKKYNLKEEKRAKNLKLEGYVALFLWN